MPTKLETQGEFAGWSYWEGDKFEAELVGPFYQREEDNGTMVGAFRAEDRHMNGHGNMHGGCMMSFADFGLFVICEKELGEDSGVTLSMSSDFISAANAGDLMEVRGEVIRAGRSIIFIRGMVTANGKPCLNFSGTVKKITLRK